MDLNILDRVIALTIFNTLANRTSDCAIKILSDSVQTNDRIYINIANITFRNSVDFFKGLPVCNHLPDRNQKIPEAASAIYLLKPTIFLIELTENFENEIQFYADNILWHPKAKFIFITNAENLNRIKFNQFMKKLFIQQFILIDHGAIYGWNTFDLSEVYTTKNNHLSLIGYCFDRYVSNSIDKKQKEQKNYLKPKIFSNFRFLTIRVSHLIAAPAAFVESNDPDITNGHSSIVNTTKHLGIEVNILETIVKWLNVNLSYENSDYFTEDFIAANKIDILFGKL